MAPAPRPRHQKALGRLHLAFSRFVLSHDLGELYLAPIDVELPDLASPVQPDLLFIDRERLGIVGDEGISGAPDLIVEVLSPSNWLTDRRDKYEIYAQAGVAEYWIVDTEPPSIEVFGLEGGGYVLLDKKGSGETVRSRRLEGLEIAVDEILLTSET